MNKINNSGKKLLSFLEEVQEQLKTQDFVRLYFSDFIDFIPSYDGSEILDKESISYLSEYFKKLSLDSEPRIRMGYIKHKVYSTILIYKNGYQSGFYSKSYRHGLLMVRVAAIMSLSDGIIDQKELNEIKSLIWDMTFLTSIEKKALYTKANYLLTPSTEIDKQSKNHIRMALNPDIVIENLSKLSRSSAQALLKVAKDIATADGYLAQGELKFLQNMYRALNLSVRSAKFDLEKHAKEIYIDLRHYTEKNLVAETELDEIDDVLGNLLTDFDDF